MVGDDVAKRLCWFKGGPRSLLEMTLQGPGASCRGWRRLELTMERGNSRANGRKGAEDFITRLLHFPIGRHLWSGESVL